MATKVRESTPMRTIGVFFSIWSILFALDIFYNGSKITSPQWQYLMSVPGHHVTWAALFASAGVFLLSGVVLRKFRLASLGFFLDGIGAAAIAVFYVFAPFADPGLRTLGYWPWIISGSMALYGAAVNWSDKKW
jgi:hypothetical protein